MSEEVNVAGKTGEKSNYDLYIVHGWTYTVEPWYRTLKILQHEGVRVKMLHVPGLTSPSDRVFTIDDYVKWADENIPDGAIALGHSNGGRILLNLCSKKPEKLKYLILLDSAGIYEVTAKKKVVAGLAKIGKPLKKIPVVNKAFHKFTGTTDYSKAPENMKKTLVNMLESDKNLKIEDVKTKTFILWGKKDTTTPPRQATMIYEKLPNAELKFYANWTHAPYISSPVELARALQKLLIKLKKTGVAKPSEKTGVKTTVKVTDNEGQGENKSVDKEAAAESTKETIKESIKEVPKDA